MKNRFPIPTFKLSIFITLILFIGLFLAAPDYTPSMMNMSAKASTLTELQNIPQMHTPPPPDIKKPNLPKRVVESSDGNVDDIDDFVTDFDNDIVINDNGDTEIYRIYDSAPQLLTELAPIYPEAAAQLGIEGTVILQLIVEKDGTVSSVDIIKSIHPLLDRAAQEAGFNLVFSPAMSRDIPVRAYVTIPVRFVIQ